MPDLLDFAQERHELIMTNTEESVRRAAAAIDTSNPSGMCLSAACGENVPTNRRWCNAECRSYWERDQGKV